MARIILLISVLFVGFSAVAADHITSPTADDLQDPFSLGEPAPARTTDKQLIALCNSGVEAFPDSFPFEFCLRYGTYDSASVSFKEPGFQGYPEVVSCPVKAGKISDRCWTRGNFAEDIFNRTGIAIP